MRKLLLICMVALFSVCSYAQEKGDQRLGAQFTFGTSQSNIGLGLKYGYHLNSSWRIAPSFNYGFENDYWSNWNIAVEANWLFSMTDNITIYPLGGLSIGGWNYDVDGFLHDHGTDYIQVADNSYTRLALNLGAGVDWDINENWVLNAELKGQFQADFTQGVINIGVAYKF